VIKRRLAGSEGQSSRWVIAHASAAPGTAGQRAILLEDISDYQRLQDELLHRERLASIGRLAAGVAHEIGNPITGIACLAQNLGALEAGEEVSQSAEEILKQSRRVSRIVNSLLQFSHGGGVEQRVELIPCNVADCIDEAIHLLSLDKRADEITLENCCDRELLVTADKQLLLQVFVNLLDNALAAAPRNTVITAHAETAADQVRICVDNEGTAIHPEVLARVFEPFFTTRDIGEGTGLGLPLVKGMVEDMRGSVALQSPRPAPLNDGTRAMVTLPRGSYTPGAGSDA
jgi:signal transduction histidine kinase